MNFLIDTSVMRPGPLRGLLDKCAANKHKVEVPALIYAERLFQLRRDKGLAFTPSDIQVWFDNYEGTLSVMDLDAPSAENLAEALFTHFPTPADWHSAKRAAWTSCLGKTLGEASGASKHCGGPVDIYIVGLASPARPIVTADKGHEWKGWPPGTVLSLSDALHRAESP